jgi:hypothetical protein
MRQCRIGELGRVCAGSIDEVANRIQNHNQKGNGHSQCAACTCHLLSRMLAQGRLGQSRIGNGKRSKLVLAIPQRASAASQWGRLRTNYKQRQEACGVEKIVWNLILLGQPACVIVEVVHLMLRLEDDNDDSYNVGVVSRPRSDRGNLLLVQFVCKPLLPLHVATTSAQGKAR